METKYGLPLVDANNIFDVLRELKVCKWQRIGEPERLDDYRRKNLGAKEKDDLRRFAPKIEVVTFKNPKEGTFVGFRFSDNDGTVIFTLLPGELIPVCAEFRHGCEVVSINLPGGSVNSGENLEASAKREFEGETGIILKNLVPLSQNGTSVFARAHTCRNFSFIGIPYEPITVRQQSFDESEFLTTVLISLEHWLTLIESREVADSYTIATTFLALRYLKRI